MSETQITGRIIERREGQALILTLARPECANAYTESMLRDLHSAVERADSDQSLGVIVVTGEGDRVFCAGADRTELAERDWLTVPDLLAARTFVRLQRSRCITMAAINGAAVGGGLELALHCDIRIATESSRFWLPEPELSLLPAAGALRLLPQMVGLLRAKDLILGGARWSAAEAHRSGLISDVVAPDRMWSTVSEWIQRINRRDPLALRWAKAILSASLNHSDNGVDRLAQATLVRSSLERS